MTPVNFSASDWNRIRETYSAWYDHSLDRPILYFTSVYDSHRPSVPGWFGFLNNFPDSASPSEIIDTYLKTQSGRRFPADSFPFWFLNFGAGVLAAALGAKTNVTEETIWFEPPEGADITKLQVSFDTDSYWWRRLQDVTSAAVDKIGDTVQISYSDLGGNLDILASLVGSEPLMIELLDHPAEVVSALEGVTAAWIAAYDLQDALIRPACPGSIGWAPTWAPGSAYMLQSDASYMISTDMFDRFVMPDLTACCRRIEFPFYHLYGIGQIPHVDRLLSIPNLRGIQWIHGDGKPTADMWPDLLNKIRDGGKLIQVFATAQVALNLVRTIGGKDVQIMITDEMTPPEANDLIERIAAAGK